MLGKGTDPQPPPSRHRGRQHPELRAPPLGSPGILCAGATRGIGNLVSPGADRGQEVHGAFSELIVRAEPRAELWTLSHGCQRGACLKSVLGNSRNAWNGEKRGKSRRKEGKKNKQREERHLPRQSHLPALSLHKTPPEPAAGCWGQPGPAGGSLPREVLRARFAHKLFIDSDPVQALESP